MAHEATVRARATRTCSSGQRLQPAGTRSSRRRGGAPAGSSWSARPGARIATSGLRRSRSSARLPRTGGPWQIPAGRPLRRSRRRPERRTDERARRWPSTPTTWSSVRSSGMRKSIGRRPRSHRARRVLEGGADGAPGGQPGKEFAGVGLLAAPGRPAASHARAAAAGARAAQPVRRRRSPTDRAADPRHGTPFAPGDAAGRASARAAAAGRHALVPELAGVRPGGRDPKLSQPVLLLQGRSIRRSRWPRPIGSRRCRASARSCPRPPRARAVPGVNHLSRCRRRPGPSSTPSLGGEPDSPAVIRRVADWLEGGFPSADVDSMPRSRRLPSRCARRPSGDVCGRAPGGARARGPAGAAQARPRRLDRTRRRCPRRIPRRCLRRPARDPRLARRRLRRRHRGDGPRAGRESDGRRRRHRAVARRPDRHRIRRSVDRRIRRGGRGAPRRPAHRDGAGPAHHAGAKHGRALVDGHDRRLQGGAARGRHPAPDVPDAQHRRRHGRRRARVRRSARAWPGCRRSPPRGASEPASRPTTCDPR